MSFSFANIDVELPLDIALFRSEIPFDSHQSYSMFYPYFDMGPVRVLYEFNNFMPDSKWTFSAGGGIIVWPFQSLAASGRASFNLCNFKNGGSLDLATTIDAGIFALFQRYYDVTNGSKTVKAYLSPALGCSLDIFYSNKEKMPFYFGGGISCGGTSLYNSIMILYAINLTVGFRI